MAQNTLVVSIRNRLGKGGARKIRREGNIPSIIYGKGNEPIPLVVNPHDLKVALSTEAGENTLLELKIKDNDHEISKLVLLRDIQFDYVTSKPIHFDFQEILMQEKLSVKVPVKIIGVAPGVKDDQGILEEILREIEIECLPVDIPNYFEVDVSQLGLGDSIHIRDLIVSEKLAILQDPEETIVTILAPKVEEEPAAVVAAGAEIGEEAKAAGTEEKTKEESSDKE